MALFIRQDDQRTEYQKRVAAELQEKLKKDKPLDYEKPVNNLEQDTQATKHLALWVSLAVLVIVFAIFYMVTD